MQSRYSSLYFGPEYLDCIHHKLMLINPTLVTLASQIIAIAINKVWNLELGSKVFKYVVSTIIRWLLEVNNTYGNCT